MTKFNDARSENRHASNSIEETEKMVMSEVDELKKNIILLGKFSTRRKS